MPPIALMAAFTALLAATLSRYAPPGCLPELAAAVVEAGCCFNLCLSSAGLAPPLDLLTVFEDPLLPLLS